MDSLYDIAFRNPVASVVGDAFRAFSDRRTKLGLPNPGSIEKLNREIQDGVFVTGYLFQGLKADLSKPFSISPLFQVSHQFFIGERLSPYTLNVIYGTNRVFMQANLDSDGSLSSRFNWRWGPSFVSKIQLALYRGGSQDMVQMDHEWTGDDFTANIKMLNPSYLDGGLTGTIIGHHLQSITPNLSLGMESVWQRPAMTEGPQTFSSYMARYKTDDWIATAQLQALGAFNASYWRKLSDRVQAGTDLTLSLVPSESMMGGLQKEGVCTVGAKYTFRASSVRAQIDSKGKICVVLEKQVTPMSPIMMTFAVDAEPASSQAKLGIGLTIEAGSEELQEQHEALGGQGPSNIPF